MKRNLFIIVLGLLLGINASFAEGGNAIVIGKIIDKTSGEGAGWATVSLMTADSTIVTGTACDSDGNYRLEAKEGDYIITASLIGYKNWSNNVSLKTGDNKIETIALEADAEMLAGATVTSRVNLVEMKIDKVVMNVSQSAFATGSNALDLLKKAPGVTVDKDGNVKLNGKTVSVWVDGRPSYMDGKSLESLLLATNGESIDKFELMEHPSSKYDAAGQGGIINIKTKKNFMSGLNGSVGIGGGGMYFKNLGTSPWQNTFRANLAYRSKKTNTFLNISEGIYNLPILLDNNLSFKSSDFRQFSSSTHNILSHSYNVKIGNDWFINDNNTLGVIVYVPGEYSTSKTLSSHTEQYLNSELKSKTLSSIVNGPSRAVRHNVNLNYTHIFDPAISSEITANADYYHNASKNENSQSDTIHLTIPQTLPAFSRKSMSSDQIYDIYSIKADYQMVAWKKFMLESGAKWAYSRTDNNSIETQTGIPDIHSNFIYSENIGAAYFSLAGQLSPKISFKAGLRGEYTGSFGDWKSSGTHTKRNYFNLFPTVFISYLPNEKWRFALSYTRRISRPSYYQLDPTKTYIDAKTYTVGNPDILPQYSHNLSLNSGLGQNFSVQLGYNYMKNTLNQIPSYDDDGIQYLTWGNFGRQHLGYAAASISALPVSKWLQWTLNLTGLYINSTSGLSNRIHNNWSAQGYTNFSFLLPKDWKVELDAYGSLPFVFGMYRMHANWMSNIAVKKNLLENRLSLTLKVDDIFRSSNSDLDIIDESGVGGLTEFKQIFCKQQILIDIAWNFGKAQKPVRHRNVGNLEEMSRVGGGGAGIGGSSK